MKTKMTIEEKKERAEARKAEREAAKKAARLEEMKNQKRVSSIAFNIEWKNSRTWGSNPHLSARIYYADGSRETFAATCGGCGYDKASTVIADLFNNFLRYKLFLVKADVKKCSERVNGEQTGLPYGIGLVNEWRDYPRYDGSIGTECYYDIAKFIGGELKKVAWGDSFTSFEYTDNETIK